MENQSMKHLWFSQDKDAYFLIPCRAVLIPGLDVIQNFREDKKFVSLEALAQYGCTAEKAKQHLYAVWQATLAATKQAWLELYAFSQQSSEEIDMSELGRQFQDGLQAAGPQAQEIFSASRDFVESVVNAAQAPQESLSEAEQKDVFKHVFSQLPQLLEQFDRVSLEAATQDPETWAENLYNKVFEKVDREKLARRKEVLAVDIKKSIAQGMRSAGITPSMDRGKGKQNTE
jgi:hypothetical protein